MIDDQRFVQAADNFDRGGNRNPENRICQTTASRQSRDLPGQQATIRNRGGASAEERNDRGLNNRNPFFSRAGELGIAF
jgi:hypothetical protein